MKRICLLSDTHGFLDDKVLKHCSTVDEIWHAGDFGTMAVHEKLSSIKPTKGVYGNVDGHEIRVIYPLKNRFICEEVDVFMTHIGGYPGRYSQDVKSTIETNPPMLFISGHSHILKIMNDTKNKGLLHINPGAAGTHGFHHVRTLVKFSIDGIRIFDLDVIELGLRGAMENKNILSL